MGVCSSKRCDSKGNIDVLDSHVASEKIPTISRQRSLVLELEEEELNVWKTLHQVGQVPCERSGHAVVLVGSTVYLFGGYGGSEPVHLADINSFDLETRRWNRIKDSGDVPCPRTAFAMCWDKQDSIFLWGGTDHDLQGLADQEVYQFHIHARKWERVVTRNRGILNLRYFGRSATAYKNSLLFFGGGVKGGRFTNELLQLDLDTMVWSRLETTGEAPCARYKHQALLVQDKLYIVGGGCYLPPTEEIDAFCLDLRTMVWAKLAMSGAALPEGRAAHTCEYDPVGHALYMWGGFNKSLVPLQDLHRLDLATGAWTALCRNAKEGGGGGGNAPPCRSFHAACFHRGSLYSFNGSDGERRYDDVARYQLRRAPARLAQLAARSVVEYLQVEEYDKVKGQLPGPLCRQFEHMLSRVPFDRVPSRDTGPAAPFPPSPSPHRIAAELLSKERQREEEKHLKDTDP
eukprot:CAMPEP_0206398526 /NCGR_PEP_ID=MMETSP0294-20121207/24219_1 /ASSEMBLY_ACC=CAM_ASM_000327 /TAXON_ID=39354 /ORGANISM="Heterosigma akashiwo, Strain CCMP2393" /LENGTH=459 /DNA_ID=CAMNT_0053854037 /DNA_START=202 /DNA_END=1582 /DNA_ORIENTATION=+